MQAFDRGAAIARHGLNSLSRDSISGIQTPAEPMYFTAGHLQRLTALRAGSRASQQTLELQTVLVRSLLSKASLLKAADRKPEALALLEEAQHHGADVNAMQTELMSTNN